MTPSQLSRELRGGTSGDLRRRRWIVGLSLVGSAMAKAVSLYQIGILRRLPDPPLRRADSSRVDASDYAYRRFQTPDGFLMLVSYGVTACLAAAGGEARARDLPAAPLAMGAKLVTDVVVAVELAREEWQENRAFCTYCQIATLCSFASLALALPELGRALGGLRGARAT
jgi:hypothetical protein